MDSVNLACCMCGAVTSARSTALSKLTKHSLLSQTVSNGAILPTDLILKAVLFTLSYDFNLLHCTTCMHQYIGQTFMELMEEFVILLTVEAFSHLCLFPSLIFEIKF